MNKNARTMGGGPAQDGGTTAPSPLATPPPISASAPSGIFPINSTPTMAGTGAPPSSGLADLRNSGPGTAPGAYGTSPQDIVNSAYGPKLPSDTSAAGSPYGDLITASGGGMVPQTGGSGMNPALAPPLTPPRPSGIDRIANTV